MLRNAIILSFIALALLAKVAYAYDIGNVKVNIVGEAGETFDDNITYINTDTKRDFITDLTVGLLAAYEGKASSLNFAGNLTQQLFSHYNAYNCLEEDATLDFKGEITSRVRMTLKDVFTHTYEYRGFEEQFGAPSGRYSYFRNRFSTDFTFDILKELAMILRYQNNMDFPSREDMNNSYFNLGGAELDYSITSKTIVMGIYNFSIRKFDPGQDATTNSMGIGARQYMTNQLYFDLKAFYEYIDSYNNDTYWKPRFNALLTGELNKRTTATIGFSKRYDTISYTQDIFDYWQISASFMRQLLARLKFFIYGFYGNGEYVNQGIQDNLFGLSASLEYELTRRAKAKVSYSFSKTDSSRSTRDYTKNTVYTGISMEF